MKNFWLKKINLFVFLLLSAVGLFAQRPVGTWKAYMAYQDAKMVAETPTKIFALYNSSLLSYTPEDESVKFYSKNDGLNDVQVSQIGYNTEAKTLVIAYGNKNIDLFDGKEFYNIPFLKNYSQIDTISSVEMVRTDAYLSTSIGIVVVDLKRKEVKTTYNLGRKTYSVCFLDNYIYAATDDGLYRAPTNSPNLQDKNNWIKYPLNYQGYVNGGIVKLVVFQGFLTFYQLNSGVYYIDKDGVANHMIGGSYNQLTVLNNQLILVGKSLDKIYFYTDFKNNTIVNLQANYISSNNNNGTYWLAQGNEGLSGIRKQSNASEYTSILSGIKVNSPKRDLDYFLTYAQDKLLIVGGGRWDNNYNLPGTLMVYDNNSWVNFNEDSIAMQTGLVCRDFTSVVVDPRDKDHYFVSSWGEGVYEFKNNKFVKLHNEDNSPLTSVYPNASFHANFVRTDGLAYDKDNNLYMLNSSVTDGIKILTADNKWISCYYEKIANRDALNTTLITKKSNQKWVNMVRNTPGMFALDENGTIGNVSDDKTMQADQFFDSDGAIKSTAYYCVTEDLDGRIWVGTDNGPLLFTPPGPTSDWSRGFSCTRIKIPYNDGTTQAYYLFEGMRINTIAVDGGNRKWIGTYGSGVYWVSPDGMEVLGNFTTENSALLSNNINSIAINNETGEIFIGTDKGLVSYMGDAITGKEDYSDVYAFPNPVRPEFTGDVVITGLMEKSTVKITDLNGNLITQGTSNGGQFTWDCRNRAGSRVASGIYLVMASTAEGKESVVTKILVVN